MRIVMMATGDIAIPSFHALLATGELVGLITQPDRPVGRHQTLTPPRIKVCAQESGIPVFQPERMRDAEAVAHLRSMQPDIVVVMAYGQILSQEVIDVPTLACINAHASLLPRHRGAACIQAAIEAGDDETGVTIMHVVKKLDAGDIICNRTIALRGTETAESLHDDLAELAPEALAEAIYQLRNGTADPQEQDESLMTYAPKLLRAHGQIDWHEPAMQVARKIRAYHSWPGTFTTYPSVKSGGDKTLKIFPPVDLFSYYKKPVDAVPGMVLEAGPNGMLISCGGPRGGAVRISTMQPPGARKMNAESFFAGHKIMPGTILGLPVFPER
ncbi:MAG: methionyl-tRNA formyltransferase [Akkermansia sp.]|nr:methionyl-tRNA formyltransferase [Akkermansia sp.]